MQRHATFVVALVAAVAVVVVVPIIGQGSAIAWAVTGVLIIALVVASVMYFVKRHNQSESSGKNNTEPSSPTPVIGNIIGARDRSIVMRNKVDSKVNIFNTSPAQPAPPKDDTEPDSH
jgi:putative exporter of polyketide antibiotics